MDASEAVALIETALAAVGQSLSERERSLLLSELPASRGPEDWEREALDQARAALMIQIIKRGLTGDTFGPISDVTSVFGQSIEQNYGLREGPFIDLARSYWTFKVRLIALSRHAPGTGAETAMASAEAAFASVFFPTYGPATVPVEQRRVAQRGVLEDFWPATRIDQFLAENPILKVDAARQSPSGCLALLLAIAAGPMWAAMHLVV